MMRDDPRHDHDLGPTAILLMAHGSRRPEANIDLFALADRLATSGAYSIVQASFLELAEPDIPTGGALCVAHGARRVLMIPYFLSEGVHLHRDLTAARNELADRFPEVAFHLGPALGPHPLLDRLVLERARQTEHVANEPCLTARTSATNGPSNVR